MLGVIVNSVTVIIGTLFGCLINKGISKKISDAAMLGVGASTIAIAVPGIVKLDNTLVVILSLVLGCIIGSAIDIDKHLNTLGALLEKKFNKNGKSSPIAQGFVSATLLFCVGAMAVVGSLNSGISGDHSTLYAKSVLDMISASIFAASLGIGVIFSAVSVFVYQGIIVLASSFLAPVLTTAAIADLTSTGSVLILLLSFNLLGITKTKLANFLPALILSPVFSWLLNLLNI